MVVLESFENFSAACGTWFDSVGFPPALQQRLYEKLRGSTLDAGSAFGIATVEEEGQDDEEQTKEEQTEEEAAAVLSARQAFALVAQKDMEAEEDVFLLDHCWTFNLRQCRQELEQNESLRKRIITLIAGPQPESKSDQGPTSAVDEALWVYDNMWRLVRSYKAKKLRTRDVDGDSIPGAATAEAVSDDEYESLWFFLDEVGSALWPVFMPSPDKDGDSSDEEADESGGPQINMCVATLPAQFPINGEVVSLSVMWPCKPIASGSICGINATVLSGGYQHGHHISRSVEAATMLFGTEEEQTRLVSERATTMLDAMLDGLEAARRLGEARLLHRPHSQINSSSGGEANGVRELPAVIPFYTDSKLVAEFVTSPRFVLVEWPTDALVMWLVHHPMKLSDDFPFARIVSQFPEERFFTNKQQLAKVLHARIGQPEWLASTYDASTELVEFIADFTARAAAAEGGESVAGSEEETAHDTKRRLRTRLSLFRPLDGANLWIAKPTNLARSIGMTVSDKLPCLLRAVETDPKILCKYIANPCTLRGRKFDLRFVVALRSLAGRDDTPTSNLRLYLYNVFWTRFAAEQYNLSDLDHYDKHFTVMNYGGRQDKLLQLHYDAFIKEFEQEYQGISWERDVHPKISKMVREAFAALPSDPIPHDRFRAVYGLDVMLSLNRESASMASLSSSSGSVSIDPTLLEITYSPDCNRACKYHPSFMNDVFHTLILDEDAASHNFTAL